MKQSQFYMLCLCAFLSAIHLFHSGNALAQALDQQDFNQLLDDQAQAPVIVLLKSPNSEKTSNKSGFTNGQWLSLGDYIDEAQRHLAKDMGWVNFNDIVKYKHVPAMAKTVTATEFKQLNSSDLVAAVYHDRINTFTDIGDIGAQLIGTTEIEDAQNAGKGTSVVIIDSGVEVNHPYFQNRVIDGACFSKAKSCPNGQSADFGKQAGRPCQGNKGCFHGTHVAGIVAGRGTKISGVAPAANILSVNVASIFHGRMGISDSDIMQALEWAYEHHQKYNIAAVNMSLGGGRFYTECDDSPVKPLIDALLSVGVITTISSGNSAFTDSVGSPGCVSTAITVGSLELDGTVSSFSNSYQHLDILAPGGKIMSASLNGSYLATSGTSMSAPQVAGAIAMLKAEFVKADAGQIIKAILSGSSYRDPRNNVKTPTLFLPSAITALKNMNLGAGGSADKPKPPVKSDKPNCETTQIDGILIEDSSSDCAVEQGGIQW